MQIDRRAFLGAAGAVLGVASGAAGAGAWLEVYGRSHLLMLHFPIALLVVGAAIELARAAAGRRGTVSDAGLACVIIGALAASATASSGWIHAEDVYGSGPDDAVLGLHRWLGVAGAGVSFVAALLAIAARIAPGAALVATARAVMILGAVAVGAAGHFGGSMVHGSGYLLGPVLPSAAPEGADVGHGESVRAEGEPEGAPPSDPPDVIEGGAPDVVAVDFATDVRPILETNCFRCHGPERQRGRLRLDDMGQLMGTLEPGDPESSTLLEVLRLPEGDDRHMPKNKPSLPEAEIALIASWVGSLEPAEAPAKEPEVEDAPAEVVPDDNGDDGGRVGAPPPVPLPVLDAAQRRARDEALARLEGRGIVAKPVARGEDAVEVRVEAAGVDFGDADLALLAGLEPALVVLDLTGTDVGDEGLASIARFGRLRRLRLGETGVTDAGLSRLSGLDELASLDLHRTGVTDEGLRTLRGLASLRRLYVWGTGVTPEGAAALRDARPGLSVDR